ncbi:MAG TPA: hypothetical protein PLZ10_13110, partial [Chitinophagaceae bacterium]|nr:hypothetical protein [Chitinophagaceae bacterium]
MPTSKKKSNGKIQQDNEDGASKLPAVSSKVQAVAKRYEETEYVDSIKADVRWLGFQWNGEVRWASD